MYECLTNPISNITISFDELKRSSVLKTIEPASDPATKEEILKLILKHRKWRYHHGIEELQNRPDLYRAYVVRIESMLDAIDQFFADFKIDLKSSSAVDLACSEGFVTNFLMEKGIKEIDAFELSEIQIERMFLIQRYKQLPLVPARQLDFEKPFWSEAIGKKYDIVFCLGILYHLQNPILFLKNVAEISHNVLVLETDTPITTKSFAGLGCLHFNPDVVTIRPGDVRPVLELRPDRHALTNMLFQAGYKSVVILPASERVPCIYFQNKQKSIVCAFKDALPEDAATNLKTIICEKGYAKTI